MADELQEPTDELDEFAQSFVSDTPEPAAAPVVEETPKPEEEKPKEEEKPAEEVKPEEEEENPFDLTEKPKVEDKPTEEKEPETPSSKTHWDTLKALKDQYKAEAEAKDTLLQKRETEIAELKAKAARAAELDEKLKVFDEQEKELALARVESTVEWKENIDKPLEAIRDQVEVLVKSNEGDTEAVLRMLREPDQVKQRTMLKEITSGWDEIDRLDLKKMSDDARILLDKQDAMRANAHATAKEQQEIASKREAETKEKSRTEFTKATTDVVKSIREKLPFLALSEGETEDDRYTSLEQKVAQVDFDAQSPRAKALAAASAFALTTAIKTISAKDKEIAELKEAVAKNSKSKPSVTSKTEAAPEADEGDFFANMGIKDPNALFGSVGLNVQGG